MASATRVSLDDDFGTPAIDPLLQAPADWLRQSQERDVPSFSGDALSLYADFGGQGSYHVYASQRGSLLDAFDVPQIVVELEAAVGTRRPFVSHDGQTLYALGSPDASSSHIYRSTRIAGHFSVPALVRTLQSPGKDSQPILSEDELTLYFSSTRTDGTAKGSGDIWVATRPDRASEFSLPRAVDELNTAAESEAPIWVSLDGCYIVFLRSEHVARARRPN